MDLNFIDKSVKNEKTVKCKFIKMHAQILRVVIASPSDVKAERDIVSKLAEELNRGIAADRNIRIDINRWETDTYPSFHPKGPQGMIDNILRIEDCDVLIGIFWKRFGTPVNDAKSGTEHEFLLAYNAWSRNRRPQLMIYFNQKSYTPKTEDELEQWKQVYKFRENLSSEGLWWTYKSLPEFEKLIRNHLTQFLLKEFSPKIENSKTNIDIKEYKFLELANSLDTIQSKDKRLFIEPWKDYELLVKTLNSFAASFHEVDRHLTRFLSLSLTSHNEQSNQSTREFLIKAEGGTLMIEAHEVRSYCNELRMIYQNLDQIWKHTLSNSQYYEVEEAFRSLETFHEVNLRQLQEIMVWLSQNASKVLHKLELSDFEGANQLLKLARVEILPQRQEMSKAVNALLSLESSYIEATRRAKKS